MKWKSHKKHSKCMNTCNKPSLSPITQETKNVNVDLKLTTRIAALRNGKRKEKSK